MADDQEERREIEAYLDQHQLQTFIGDAVNDIVKERPADPLVTLADALRACSDASRQIQKVRGRQILNGEALPALEIEILTSQVITSNLFQSKEEKTRIYCAWTPINRQFNYRFHFDKHISAICLHVPPTTSISCPIQRVSYSTYSYKHVARIRPFWIYSTIHLVTLLIVGSAM